MDSASASASAAAAPASPMAVSEVGSQLATPRPINTHGRISPTAADMEQWTTVGDIMSWVGLCGDADDESTPEWSLMDLIGCSVETPIRELGQIAAEEFESVITEWQYCGRRPSLLLRAKAKALGHFSRVYLGIEYTAEEKLAYEAKQEAHARAVALRAATPAAPAVIQQTAPEAASTSSRMARFRDIADASRSGEVAVMDFETQSGCIARYRKVMHGKKVPEHCEPTAMQLSVLQVLLSELNVPYVDFAIWGPYANRITQALRGSGLMFNTDMELVTEQFKGPPSFKHWKACWQVYQTALIMLGAADPPVLTAYMEKIESLARQFTPVCWGLIYQAEARFRQDKLTQIQRQEIEKLEEAVAEGRSYKHYDPLRPWNRCFELATEGQYAMNYWHDQIEIKAIMILSAARPQSEYLDGDCPIAPSSSAHIATYYSTPSDIGLAVESGAGRASGGLVNTTEGDLPSSRRRSSRSRKNSSTTSPAASLPPIAGVRASVRHISWDSARSRTASTLISVRSA